MPIGLSCAPAIFQRIIEQTVADILGVACYLDEIIIMRKTTWEIFKRPWTAHRQWIPTTQE